MDDELIVQIHGRKDLMTAQENKSQVNGFRHVVRSGFCDTESSEKKPRKTSSERFDIALQ